MAIYLVFLGFIFWLLSSLIVHYFTENVRDVREQKIAFHKLSLEIRNLLLEFTWFLSSGKQYVKSCDNFKDGTTNSIWFPDYNFPQIKELIPFSLYRKESKFLLDQLIKLDNVCYSLNKLVLDLNINEIKEHFLSWIIPRDETLIRYLDEWKIINLYLEEIEKYIQICFTILSSIRIINERNSKNFIFKLNVKFTERELSDKIDEIQKDFFDSFSSYEEVH